MNSRKNLIKNFIISAVLCALPSGLLTGASALLGYLTGIVPLMPLGVIPSAVFWAGLIGAALRLFLGEESNKSAAALFFDDLKNNFKAFLVHGAAFFLILSCAVFAMIYYGALATADPWFLFILCVYAVFIALLLCLMLYASVLTPAEKTRFRDIYKNAWRLIFGGKLRSLAATLGVLALIAALVFAAVFTQGAVRVAVIAVSALLLPPLVCLIYVPLLIPVLQTRLGLLLPPEPEPEDEPIDLSAFNSDDDYIFINGKMIKNPNKKAGG